MGIIGQSVTRVDAPDKVTGRAKYTDDIADKSALIAKVLHSSIAHGYVKSAAVISPAMGSGSLASTTPRLTTLYPPPHLRASYGISSN